MMPSILACNGGALSVEDHGSHRRVRFQPDRPEMFVPRMDCETDFPLELLAEIAATAQSGAWICEALARFDAPEYVLGAIRRQLEGYFPSGFFAGKRLMDFGCGAGASTFGLAAMLPSTEIVGVELSQDSINMALRVARHRSANNLSFQVSPSGSELPRGIGQFDAIMLSAVWEHLLPSERPVITKLLWDALRPEGALFINQTPYRWFPKEHHTTGLWGLNYLPDWLALSVARKHSRETPEELAECSWPEMLRRGIRGGTEGEVLRLIRRAGGKGTVLQPLQPYRDRADYWLQSTSKHRRKLKALLAKTFAAMDTTLGTMPVPHLDIVIRKVA